MLRSFVALTVLVGTASSEVEKNLPADDIVVPRRRQGNEIPLGVLGRIVDLTNEEKQKFVDLHNEWRNKAALGELNTGRKAKNMPRMFWDEELADHAKRFSHRCQWQHSKELGWGDLNYDYGENLYAATGYGEEPMIQMAVDTWALEHRGYNHDTHECNTTFVGMCGHYTQMVWEHSTRVGCAKTYCESMTNLNVASDAPKDRWSIVCQYYKRGNLMRTDDPYEMSQFTGVGCSSSPYFQSTGLSTKWPGLCNNANDICSAETHRCGYMQDCASQDPISTEDPQDTVFTCGRDKCIWREFSGVQIHDAQKHRNGMRKDDTTWAWFDKRVDCEAWCYAHKDATTKCLGCTQQDNRSEEYWFAVWTVDESDREASTREPTNIPRLIVLDCSQEGGDPTTRPTEPGVPTGVPTHAPVVPESYSCDEEHMIMENVEIKWPFGHINGFKDENDEWFGCKNTDDGWEECIQWCAARRFDEEKPCIGVTTGELWPSFVLPIKTIDESMRVDRVGAKTVVLNCRLTRPGGVEEFPTYSPVPPPTIPVPLPGDPANCPKTGRYLPKCGKCLYSAQCGEGMYCCPFMKKCVTDAEMPCTWPVAWCKPERCYEHEPGYPESCDSKCEPRGEGTYAPNSANNHEADENAEPGVPLGLVGITRWMDNCPGTPAPTNPTESPTRAPTDPPTDQPTKTPTEFESTLCDFIPGDGQGGPEKFMGYTDSAHECAVKVLSYDWLNSAWGRRPKGATWGKEWHDYCYAEFEMDRVDVRHKDTWSTCFFDERTLLPSESPTKSPSDPPSEPPTRAPTRSPIEFQVCNFAPGNLSGGTEKHVGKTDSAQECSELVQSLERTADGATYSTSRRDCYAEFNPTSRWSSSNYESCKFGVVPTESPTTVPTDADAPPICTFSRGDGYGGDDKYMGQTDTEIQCAHLVKANVATATGATWGTTYGTCYAEINPTGIYYMGPYRYCEFPAVGPSAPSNGGPTPVVTSGPTPTPSFDPTLPPTNEQSGGLCTFGPGDGYGGYERYVGRTDTDQECAALVQETQPTANGATWGPRSGYCYAEFGMTRQTSSSYWTTCMFERKRRLQPFSLSSKAQDGL